MGNTQKTGNYVNAIFQDTSNNVGIGGSPSGSYKLEVTGTGRFTGNTIIGTRTTGNIRNLNIYGATNGNAILKLDGADGNGYGAQVEFISKNSGGTSNQWTLGTGINTGSNTFELYNGTGVVMAATIAGYVGIGIVAPTNLLQVSKDLTGEAIVSISNTSSTGFGLGINAGATTRYVLSLNDYANNALVRFLGSGDIYIGSTSVTTSNISMYWEKGTGTLTQVFSYSSGTKTIQEYYRQSGSSVGSITYNGTNVILNPTSDQRLKENIVDSGSGLDKLSKVKIRAYDWKESGMHTDFGIIAQEIFEVAPECVRVGTDEVYENGNLKEPWCAQPYVLVSAAVKAIQELNQIVQELNDRLNKAGL